MIDLHTHSSASDGDLSPEALIQKAAAAGLSAIALTDHDTINGLVNARNEAAIRGICFIPGIEIEITWSPGLSTVNPPGEFHLLGLGISRPAAAFVDAVGELSRLREARNGEILEKMNELGIEASYEDITSLSGEAGQSRSIGRPHFAAFLVSRNIVKNREQAFARYLGRGKPFYVPKKGMEFEKAAALIRESGGIPVLAHPMSLYIAWGRLPGFIKELKDRGLAGIEAWHPTARPRSCRRLEALGKSLGLYITEGSDFHGAARPDRKLGYSAGDRKIEDSVLEAIPELKAR
jgi:predicted metal-dependent phosphoesterase TrpH